MSTNPTPSSVRPGTLIRLLKQTQLWVLSPEYGSAIYTNKSLLLERKTIVFVLDSFRLVPGDSLIVKVLLANGRIGSLYGPAFEEVQ